MASIRQQIRDERKRPVTDRIDPTCPPLQEERDVPPCGPLDEEQEQPPMPARGGMFSNLFRGNREDA